MAKFRYLDIDCAAWVMDTRHLSRAARGLYMDMIMLCWASSKCKLPNDRKRLAELLMCKDKSELNLLDDIVKEFWKPDRHGRWLQQKRLCKEWEASTSRQKQAFVNAKSRWDKDKKASRNASTVTGTVLDAPTGHSNTVPARARARSANGATRDATREEKKVERPPGCPPGWDPEAWAFFERQKATLEPMEDDDGTRH